jgi:proteasome lid subunit RPN8/RPN11
MNKILIRSQIKKHALDLNNEEVCGFIYISDSGRLKSIRCDNLHDDKKNQFLINPKEFIKLKKNYIILSVYHSHINCGPEPSKTDLMTSEELCLPYYIYSLKSDSFFLSIPRSYQPELFGRRYIEEFMNSFVFVKNYYEQKFELYFNKKYNYIEHDDPKLYNSLMINALTEVGFEEIDLSDIKKNDMILFNNKNSEYYSCGVYQEKNKLAHHQFKKKSCVSSMTNYGMDKVYKVYRLNKDKK